MIKYASNSVLATMISFSNEIAGLCTALGGVDAVDVMDGVHASAYFTTRQSGKKPVKATITSFLSAGCGFGGSCLPKDVRALAAQGNDYDLPMDMLNSVITINQGQPSHLVNLIKKQLPILMHVRIAILGLAFKPDTDDVRESPSFPIIRLLRDEGATLTAYDPIANSNAQAHLADVDMDFADSMQGAIVDAEVVIILTAWDEFRSLPNMIQSSNPQALVVDGRRILNKHAIQRYVGIGL
jgi:UDPglucose 6-dehydrogenase/GDP-mannose 6-dehydrogenase